MDKNRIILITQKDSKREHYFLSALEAIHSGCHVFYGFSDYWKMRMAGDVIKIDPPDISAYGIEELTLFTERYKTCLKQLDSDRTLRFLNTPAAISMALDKAAAKKALLAAKVDTPAAFDREISSFDELLNVMESEKCSRVFVKPRYGSGAAGVCAFAWNFKKKQCVLYTSLAKGKSGFMNTKKVTKSMDFTFCREVICFVLSLGAVVEHWVPKPSIDGVTFDLRVVWQFGGIDTIVVRGAKNPITNLHLNDMALKTEAAKEWIDENALLKICSEAVAAIPGLRSAGLDLLCKADGYQVIEINSQGDLIYKDIYKDNIIYTKQACYLTELAEKGL